jgi:uncharacterized protein with ParB-like and HNH nuclease domain
MANELEKSITIRDAIDRIDSGFFLLPSIQRRFVWNTTQIEFLFDSIMQDYPINTFMFWEVVSKEIKNQFRFYDFLKKYVEYKGGNNEERNTKGYHDFNAVIDGQQRLNSLYIGLKGSYSYKHYVYHKKKYHHDEENYPTRKLYLDLLNPIENDEEKKVYDFRFLINNEFIKECETLTKEKVNENGIIEKIDCYWFEVGKILEFSDLHSVVSFLSNEKLELSGFAGKTILKLYDLLNSKPIINYYLEKDQDFDKILHEFIRTNSGGTKLSFADLLMSIITATWEKSESSKGAREELDNIIREINNLGFEIDQDFVLKTCLVLFSPDIRFALRNFGTETITKIKDNWGTLASCMKAGFELVGSLAFNNHSLRAKNAVIPVVYFLYMSKRNVDINKENKYVVDKKKIKQYLHIALLNKVFSGSADGFLSRLRNIIFENHDQFPLEQIKEAFKGTGKSFNISDERIDTILRTSYDNLDCFYVLALLFPTFNFEFKNPNIDHLHPISQFQEENYSHLNTEEDKDFFRNHHNTVLNLALLSEEQNKSKNKTALKFWIEEQEKANTSIRNSLLIPEAIDLDFKQFKDFIERREILLKDRIRENIN